MKCFVCRAPAMGAKACVGGDAVDVCDECMRAILGIEDILDEIRSQLIRNSMLERERQAEASDDDGV